MEYGTGTVWAELPETTDIFIPGVTVPDPPHIPEDQLVQATLDSLRHPIGMPPLSELAHAGSRCVIVFPDRVKGGQQPTSHRKVAIRLIVNELLAAGVRHQDILLICSNGLHRKNTEPELRGILGPELFEEFWGTGQILNHDSEDDEHLVDLGKTEQGDPVIMNKYVHDADVAILIGHVQGNPYGGYSGGYKHSAKMCIRDSDGTGIQMGLAAGGTTYMMGVAPMIHILQVPNLIKNDDLTADQKAILSALALVKGETSVTVNGEALDPTLPEAMIPEYKYYNVYTAEQMEAYKNEGLTENFASATSMFLGQGGSFEVGQPIADLDTILEVGQQYKNVLKADSIQSLAEQIGCDADVLAETLGGEDTTYYAVIVSGYTYGTVGGLDVDVNMNVLREDGTPIANPVSYTHLDVYKRQE